MPAEEQRSDGPSSGAHEGLMCPLENGIGGIKFNKSSSDDRPGPGICDSKYVEDAKAAIK